MSMDADFGTTSRPVQARGSYSNRKRKHVPGQGARLLLTAIEKIAFSGQRTLQFDDHPFEVGVQEPSPSTRVFRCGHNLAKFHKPYRASATGLLSRVWFEH
jgi:hypothetical protein